MKENVKRKRLTREQRIKKKSRGKQEACIQKIKMITEV
jgi:hypothetical protein